MAATRLIPLHISRGKTALQSFKDRIDYARNPDKTEQEQWVSTYQCHLRTIEEDFQLTRQQYLHQTGRTQSHEVIAYQIRQSFKPGEITPAEANRIGQELALRFTKGKHAFLVATHTDRSHIHNHILFQSITLDGKRKFRNFYRSSFALQRISDLLCLENGLSIIQPAPRPEQTEQTIRPKRNTLRDTLKKTIDQVLAAHPPDWETFLQLMEQQDYHSKPGKHTAFRGGAQKRYIRLDSLGEPYTEASLRAALKSQTPPARTQPQPPTKQPDSLNLLLDIQQKIQQKGIGYGRWATGYNLKQLSKTLLFLRDHQITNLEDLTRITQTKTTEKDTHLAAIRQVEQRMKELSELRNHIIQYLRTKDTYTSYRKAGYSKTFFEAHRQDITLHQAAKAAFDRLHLTRLPRIKDLNQEYTALLQEKKQTYARYKKVKDDLQEYLIAKKNIETLYQENQKQEEERKRKAEHTI